MDAKTKFPATDRAVGQIRAARKEAEKHSRPAPETVKLNPVTWGAICAEFKAAGNYFQTKNPDVGHGENSLYGLRVETDSDVPREGAWFRLPEQEAYNAYKGAVLRQAAGQVLTSDSRQPRDEPDYIY